MNFSTKKYYQDNSPSYCENIYHLAGRHLKGKKLEKVLDVGCGDGQGIKYLSSLLGVEVCGMEEATVYKEKLARLKNKIFYISALDEAAINKITERFDVIVISRVLHHLVSDSPYKSREVAANAVKNLSKLLKNEAEVIILEPIFEPALLNKLVFYIKKLLAPLGRVKIFGYWNNLGAPVVNYFSKKEIFELFKNDYSIKQNFIKTKSTFVVDLIFERYDCMLILKKR